MMADKLRCPECGLPTTEDRSGVTWEEKLCEACYLEWSSEDHIDRSQSK